LIMDRPGAGGVQVKTSAGVPSASARGMRTVPGSGVTFEFRRRSR
jgi:hypothetical protein